MFIFMFDVDFSFVFLEVFCCFGGFFEGFNVRSKSVIVVLGEDIFGVCYGF